MRLTQTDCSFDQDDADYYKDGTYVAISLSICLSGIVATIAFFTLKYSWNKTVPPLTHSAVISVADFIVYLTMTIEVLQTLALAPGLHVVDVRLAQFLAVFQIDLFELELLREDAFFIKLNLFLCTTTLWVVSSFWLLIRLRRSAKELSKAEQIALNVSYFMTHVAAVPILSSFVETYICDVEDSSTVYLRQDCNCKCWEAKQSTYFTVSMLALAVFSSISVLQAPLWQEHALNLHIKAQPSSVLLRFAVQFFLLSVKRALESGQLVAYSVIYSCTTTAWAVYNFKRRPYNYIRTNMWNFSGIIVCAWSGILLIIAHAASPGLYLNVLLGLGWSLIIGFTFHRQHYHLPTLLPFTMLHPTEITKPHINESKDSNIEVSDLLSPQFRRHNVDMAVGEVLCPANSRVDTTINGK